MNVVMIGVYVTWTLNTSIVIMATVVYSAIMRAVEQISFISDTGNIIQPYRTTSLSIESISTWNGTYESIEYGYLINWIFHELAKISQATVI